MMQSQPLSEAALTTLRYWTPGVDVIEHWGQDPEAHEAAASDGLIECMDAGLLDHVPNFSEYADGYRTNERGQKALLAAGKEVPA